MKTITLFTAAFTAIIISSCSGSNPKTEIKEQIRTNIVAYLEANTTPEDMITIDSVVVLDVDTLTAKGSAEMKLNYLMNEYIRQSDIVQNQEIKLSSSKSLDFDEDMIDVYESELEEESNKLSMIQSAIDHLKEKQNSLDNKKFKYYLVKSKVYITEKSAAKNLDITTCANEAYKVVESKDL